MRAGRPGIAILALSLAAGCSSDPAATTATTTRLISSFTASDRPQVREVTAEESDPATYDLVEMIVSLDAEYQNPFDQREVALDGVFTGPDGSVVDLPGFWDGEESWRLRFTPSVEGTWEYSVTVTDHRGVSQPHTGQIEVTSSQHPGFIRMGSQVDPGYSPRYFAYENGAAWYGRGHADLDMSLGGPSPDGRGLRKFTEMSDSGENYEMWWPMWGNNYIQESYDNYAPAQMNIIDFVVADAAAKGVALVYTIWGHQFLRTADHEWPDDRWNFNGFSELTGIDEFFIDPESWAWQENYYRYIIARWSYSPAILMWQTVTEINGTESYAQTNPWHEKVNAYFQDHDPYRHPTTATKSGAQDWPEGHAFMDVPQVHLYHVFGDNPIADGARFAEWTTLMWDREEKPNWIGEYGNRVQALYPEFMHNVNWTSLASGAALTPTEWNDLNAFGSFDDAMKADMSRFAGFVEAVPLVTYDPDRVDVTPSNAEMRGWGVVGESGGVVWVQDFALEDATIEEIRADETVRTGVTVTVDELVAGSWTVTSYDTWQGLWAEPISISCPGGPCEIPLPDFHSDVAIALER